MKNELIYNIKKDLYKEVMHLELSMRIRGISRQFYKPIEDSLIDTYKRKIKEIQDEK